jgi:cytochrome c553
MIARFFKIAAHAALDALRALWTFQGLKIAVTLAVLGAVAGLVVAASGIVPIKASSGHWAITEWFLQFAKQRSVDTHTLMLEAPPLDEPWLVLKGAGHYDIGCRPCHGSPELKHPRIAQHMLPPPPYLPEMVNNWDREELFFMVKHGIKFTGMPAWPSQQRDDEVWAMVAFLRAFPGLGAEEYRTLVYGEAPAKKEVEPLAGLETTDPPPGAIITNCGRCHGVDGRGRDSAAFPILAGQRLAYLEASLEAYARGQRHSGIMEPIAAALTSEQIRELSRYYASLEAPSAAPSLQQDSAAARRGQAIARQGIPNQDVPACADCHGPSDTPRNSIYPLLAGQHADYLALQLTLFKQEQRGGTAFAHLMRHVATKLTAEQINDVARYYAALRPTLVLPALGETTAEPVAR